MNIVPPFNQKAVSAEARIVSSPFAVKLIKLRIAFNICRVALKKYGNILKALRILKAIHAKRKQYLSGQDIQRFAKKGSQYFWIMGGPTWPSRTFDRYVEGEMDRIRNPETAQYLRLVVFGITKRCWLSCQHCYEWKNLNKQETLTDQDILNIVHRLQHVGVAQIQISGGEPLLRYKTILTLLDASAAPTDFWLLTSGMGLTPEKALELKGHGLTGINVSIDHHIPEKHSRFRGHPDSFNSAVQAVRYSKDAGLWTCITLCPTPEYISEKNLFAYRDMCKELGVPLIQILEPRNSGRWQNRNSELGPKEIRILEHFYLKVNFNQQYGDGPLISYHGYNQRRNGCFAAGNRFFYIDTEGHARTCPFCPGSIGSVLVRSMPDVIRQLQARGCSHIQQPKVFA